MAKTTLCSGQNAAPTSAVSMLQPAASHAPIRHCSMLRTSNQASAKLGSRLVPTQSLLSGLLFWSIALFIAGKGADDSAYANCSTTETCSQSKSSHYGTSRSECSCMCQEHVGLLIGQSLVRLEERGRWTRVQSPQCRQRLCIACPSRKPFPGDM